MKDFTVLTEETPNIDEIRIMVQFQKYELPLSYTNDNIIPNIKDNVFSGEWNITTDDCNIKVLLFKGETSSVDYMLFEGDVDLTNGNAEQALCVLESTKTNDKSARNTAVLQRISKFEVYKKMYPNSKAIFIMFWLDSKWKDTLTNTAILGFRMMITLNIQLYASFNGVITNLLTKYNISPFNSSDELIEYKNNIKEKNGNVSIKLSRDNDKYNISLKLDKGQGYHAGKISHDPNVGFLSAVINCFEKFNTNIEKKYIINEHGINQDYFDKSPSSKLWYAIYGVKIEFTNCIIKNLPELPNRYFKIENEMTEKLCTILCDMTSKCKTIFSNHGGCALTNIKGLDFEQDVGRTMHRPDIVFENSNEKEIWIIEGKLEKELMKGIKQLSDEYLKGFIDILKKMYPDYTIKKGLCITICDINEIHKYNDIEFPIKFALDKGGNYIDLR